MNSQLQLLVDNQAGALERLLRVTRHRGYKVHHFAARTLNDEGIEVTMQIEGSRPLMNLITQLSKLEEVRRLSAAHKPVRIAA